MLLQSELQNVSFLRGLFEKLSASTCSKLFIMSLNWYNTGQLIAYFMTVSSMVMRWLSNIAFTCTVYHLTC